MKIVFENKNYIVIHKPAGLATQTARLGQTDLVCEVKNHIAKSGMKNPYVAVINRLDQPVEGLVLLAKNEKTAKELSRQLTNNQIDKYYEAYVSGSVDSKEGKLTDYLLKDAKTNSSKVVSKNTKDAKEAVLEYMVIKKEENTLLRVHLITGRHHQIRIQMSNMGHPILGDTKYGDADSILRSKNLGINTVALKAVEMSFKDPDSGKRVTYTIDN